MKFNFRLLTHSPETVNVQSGKLGATSAEVFSDADVGKPVKKGTQGNFVLCGEDDAIEGFIDTVDAGGKIDGMSFGGVAIGSRGFRKLVTVVTDDETAVAVGSYVAAEDNAVAGTENEGGLGLVKVSATPTRWKIVSLVGDIAATTESVCAMVPNPSFDDQEEPDPITNPEEVEECKYPEQVIAVIELV